MQNPPACHSHAVRHDGVSDMNSIFIQAPDKNFKVNPPRVLLYWAYLLCYNPGNQTLNVRGCSAGTPTSGGYKCSNNGVV
jgi:hypothetical protein